MDDIPTLKIRVGDRHYSDISFVRAKDLTPIAVDIPTNVVLKNKLFNQDIFEYDSSKESCQLYHSSIRSMPVIPAVWYWKVEEHMVNGKEENHCLNVSPMTKDCQYFLCHMLLKILSIKELLINIQL